MRTPHTKCTVLVDVTGGADRGKAALQGSAEASLALKMPLSVVGDEPSITEALEELPHDAEQMRVIHAPADDDEGELGGRGLLPALRMAAQIPDSVVVTAAPRAQVILEARQELRLLAGVSVPALAAVYPTLRERGAKRDPFGLLLDVGANLECTPEALRHFALMGACYSHLISETDAPRVALLANTRHLAAVPRHIRLAHEHLERSAAGFTYVGLQNPSRVMLGEADVLVSDGYSGELVIRSFEGLALTAEELIAQAGTRLRWKVGVSMLGGGINTLREFIDWDNYGGSPVLGFERPIIVIQPNAGRQAYVNAARLANKIHRERVWERIRASLENHPWTHG